MNRVGAFQLKDQRNKIKDSMKTLGSYISNSRRGFPRYLAGKRATVSARVPVAIVTGVTGATLAFVNMGVQAFGIDGLVTTELALDTVAETAAGRAGLLLELFIYHY